MRIQLRSRGWLRREFEITESETRYIVEYYGRGAGWEGVRVNGELVTAKQNKTWFVPRFEFRFGQHQAEIHIRVWPWFAVRSLSFLVDGIEVYAEGT